MKTPVLLIPAPNGPAKLLPGSLALPDPLPVSLGGFAPDCLLAFAQRAGLQVAAGGCSPLLRCVRNAAFPEEAYRLRVTQKAVEVEASTERGVIWALTSLFMLLEEGKSAPCCDAFDAPAMGYRGIMMDTCRHFFPVETLKELIEEAALAKLNVLHWGLSNDQGWRVESFRFPGLHEQCAPDYYTQAQVREIVEYARLRGVEVVPEINMPGHSTAMLAAFPELGCRGVALEIGTQPGIYSTILCAGRESTYEFLLPLLEEIAALFPSPRFHIGGDEVPKKEWKTCPHCQKRMEELGLTDWEDLQGWFTCRVNEHLKSLGKEVFCWNETLLSAAAPQDITVQYWAEMHKLGDTRRFYDAGGRLVYSDYLHLYLDQPHSFIPLKRVYHTTPETFEGPNTLGMECCVWTEFIETKERLWEQAFPRAIALAEAAWTRPAKKDYGDFLYRLGMWNVLRGGQFSLAPKRVDPPFGPAWKERVTWLRFLKNEPFNMEGVGGMHPRFLAKWIRYYL